MRSAIAAKQVDAPREQVEREARTRHEAKPPSDHARYEPRFRVVTRKPLVSAQPVLSNPLPRTSLLAAIPALCLLVYVLFWTLAMRGGPRPSSSTRQPSVGST